MGTITAAEMRKKLEALAEPDYKAFNVKLMPGVNPENVLGVRIPSLRKLAKEAAKSGWKEYVEGASDHTFEEILIQGLVLGYSKASWKELEPYIGKFLEKVDNWAVCDSFCNSLTCVEKSKEEAKDFLEACMRDSREYFVRFGLVMILDFYVEEPFIPWAFGQFDKVSHEGYYVKMAKAWAISMYYVKFPAQTMEYLKVCKLDDWTFNKALQKITESRCVDGETKKVIKSMKRK